MLQEEKMYRLGDESLDSFKILGDDVLYDGTGGRLFPLGDRGGEVRSTQIGEFEGLQ